MGPTTHQTHLTHTDLFGQFSTQVHGIAHGPQATYRLPLHECSCTSVTTVAQLLAFRHFGISAFTDSLCVCSVCTHLVSKHAAIPLVTNLQTISPFN